MQEMMNWLKEEESGQGMVEYALIIALVAVALVIALGNLKGGIEGVFTKVNTELTKTGK